MFDLYLTGEVVPETAPGVIAIYGKIRIETHGETFTSSLVSWNQARYYEHWHLALQRLIEGQNSAIITSFVEPHLSRYLVWWPLYRQGSAVHIQNQMLFYDQLPMPFSIQDPWRALRERQTVNQEGQPISEWTTDLASIEECLIRIQQRAAQR